MPELLLSLLKMSGSGNEFKNFALARADIFDYIEVFSSGIDRISPDAYVQPCLEDKVMLTKPWTMNTYH
ncbi:hypothetical protein BOQ07_28505 [Klebsiella michiganensis]|nr:hypothetical protein BOQ07_28505 [Klebsiella michiganensis]